MSFTMRDRARDGLIALSRDATNLSGLCQSLARLCIFLREETGLSVEETNSHPIVKMYLYRMAELAGLEASWDQVAYEEVRKLAEASPARE